MADSIYDVIIIGGGPGGYTAALYAARAGLETLVLERLSAGGQMALTHQLDDLPLRLLDWLELSLLGVYPHRLGHASHQHVFAEQGRRLAMQVVGKGLEGIET